ncbi:hypothetical protein LCB40_12630 [Lactobacillus corticis]|uniref:Uncharacterized protein n=1 Tax=Lactobacillus corticis TaxID=2201249 RepID=A0A916QJ17_9LACO|nr:hypothetical protein LCB40_12630 [Lactobacillus corticis]
MRMNLINMNGNSQNSSQPRTTEARSCILRSGLIHFALDGVAAFENLLMLSYQKTMCIALIKPQLFFHIVS